MCHVSYGDFYSFSCRNAFWIDTNTLKNWFAPKFQELIRYFETCSFEPLSWNFSKRCDLVENWLFVNFVNWNSQKTNFWRTILEIFLFEHKFVLFSLFVIVWTSWKALSSKKREKSQVLKIFSWANLKNVLCRVSTGHSD